jgi:hypothetical protein
MRSRHPVSRVRSWWRRLPARIVLGAGVAVVAIAGLAWQHYHQQVSTGHAQPPQPTVSAPSPAVPGPGDLGDTSVGQLDPPTVTLDANSAADARVVVTRFATNFGSPNGNRDDWLARISPDVSAQLVEQYRLTDIRNVTQAAMTAVDGPVRQEPASLDFDVTYDDGSRIEVDVETGPDGWKAINVVPLSSNGLPAPSSDVAGQQPAVAAAVSGSAQETR